MSHTRPLSSTGAVVMCGISISRNTATHYTAVLSVFELPEIREKRRLRGDLIETFKIVTGRDKVKMEDFFTAVEVSTTSVVTSSR